MRNKNKTFSVTLIILIVLLVLYAYFIIIDSPILAGLFSFLNSAAAGVMTLTAFFLCDRKQQIRFCFLLISIACFSWMLGDAIWGMYIFNGEDPTQNVLATWFYFVPNIIFGIAAVFFGYSQYSKWRSIKGIIESLTIGVLSILIIWIVFFNKDDLAISFLTSDGFISAASIFIDIFIFIEFLIWFFSDSRKKIPVYILLVSIGIFLYATVDLIYYYIAYKNLYMPNSITDLLYIVSIMVIAAGALWKRLPGSSIDDLKVITEDRSKSKWAYLLAFPAFSIAAEGFNIIDLLIITVIICLYHASIKYIQLANENERLLENEFSINAKLEKRIEEQLLELSALANQDTITKLYNRRYFSVCLVETIELLQQDEILAVLQFDVDRFKTINDSYGHDVGDKVIIELSKRLLEWNTSNSVISRLGGDEFAILLHGFISTQQLEEYCSQIVELCSAPIFIDNQVLYITISIGVSVCPKDARDSVSLLKNSDIAMYRAKAEGFNRFVFFSPSFKENLRRKNEIEALLRKADMESDFELVFQPQFELPDKLLIGAEALLRWKNPEHGYIPPSIFIPVAEEIDYISRIGKWVLKKAIEQIVAWNKGYLLNLKMGVNISPKQLVENDFFITLKTIIASNKVNTAWLDAEITENLMIEEKSKVKAIFNLFRELNISVSIDDFGSGYSSLGYLNKYHYDRIKIDKSLIDNLLLPGGSGIEVVKAIISMAKAVGKTTIAEGVETLEQLNILTDLGCSQVQGYLLGKPVPADIFEKKYFKPAPVMCENHNIPKAFKM